MRLMTLLLIAMLLPACTGQRRPQAPAVQGERTTFMDTRVFLTPECVMAGPDVPDAPDAQNGRQARYAPDGPGLGLGQPREIATEFMKAPAKLAEESKLLTVRGAFAGPGSLAGMCLTVVHGEFGPTGGRLLEDEGWRQKASRLVTAYGMADEPDIYLESYVTGGVAGQEDTLYALRPVFFAYNKSQTTNLLHATRDVLFALTLTTPDGRTSADGRQAVRASTVMGFKSLVQHTRLEREALVSKQSEWMPVPLVPLRETRPDGATAIVSGHAFNYTVDIIESPDAWRAILYHPTTPDTDKSFTDTVIDRVQEVVTGRIR